MNPSKSEMEFLEETLKAALLELEELEAQLDWYSTKVIEQIEEALEIIEGLNGAQDQA